jgi:tetratricopeptide (TPR) repeat protein
MRQLLFILLLLAIGWQNASAGGSSDQDKWRKNTSLLPPYCQDRAGGDFEKWRRPFGDVFIHLHHYCSGIFSEQKAKSAQKKPERAKWLGEVVSSMRYVSSACNQRCVLYPELHTRWGWALSKQGQIAEAIQHYQLALKAKRDYTLAYVRLSELYLKANQPDEARKVLESGLKARPNSSALKKRLKKLDSSE